MLACKLMLGMLWGGLCLCCLACTDVEGWLGALPLRRLDSGYCCQLSCFVEEAEF